MKRLIITMALAAAVLSVLAGCAGEGAGPDHPGSTTTLPIIHPRTIAALVSSDSCDDLLDWIKDQAMAQVTAYGLGQNGRMYPMYAMEDKAASSELAAPSAAGSADSAARNSATDSTASSDDTGTNNQVAGVDEGDMVKIDGDRALVLHGSVLTVVSLTPTLTTLGSVPVPDGASQLLVVGDRAYVLSSGFPTYSGPAIDYQRAPTDIGRSLPASNATGPSTTITEVAIADQPTLSGSRTVDGSVIASRRANGAVRIVTTTQSPANLGFVTPDRPASEPTALEANKAIIANSKLEDWLPSKYDQGDREPLVGCPAVFHPADFSGFGALSVLTITDGLDSLSATSVIADGETTYASATSLYVATTRWQDQSDGSGSTNDKVVPRPTEVNTDVHRFDISTDGPAVYQGSGRVPGTVINQYAMDEADGVLRIATTRAPISGGATPTSTCPPDAECMAPDIAPSPTNVAASRLTTLKLDGQQLVEVGHLDGLGPSESIQGVRYVGTLAYVVTFRNTDPLFVIDLADPASPKLLGELKSPGFSNYLHPVGDGRLLGVGVDGTEEGSSGGAKVSLYDTTNPTSPKEVGSWTSENTSLDAGNDPHAFVFDPATGLAVIVGSWSDRSGESYQSGAVVLKVTNDSVTEVGRIVRSGQPGQSKGGDVYYDGNEPISRTFFHSGAIYAVSDSQVSSHDEATTAQTAVTQL